MHSAQIDPSAGEQLQTEYTIDREAETVAELVRQATLCSDAAWAMVARANERKYMRALRVKAERRRLLQQAEAGKKKVRRGDLERDEIDLNTAALTLEAEIRADAEMRGEDPDTVVARLKAEAEASVVRPNGHAPEL